MLVSLGESVFGFLAGNAVLPGCLVVLLGYRNDPRRCGNTNRGSNQNITN